jgi:adenosine deaminase
VVFLALEQHVERGQGSVAARDVLLEADFVFVGEDFVCVDALLEDAQAVAEHDDFVEKRRNGQVLVLQIVVSGLERERSADPFVAELDRSWRFEELLEHVFDSAYYVFERDAAAGRLGRGLDHFVGYVFLCQGFFAVVLEKNPPSRPLFPKNDPFPVLAVVDFSAYANHASVFGPQDDDHALYSQVMKNAIAEMPKVELHCHLELTARRSLLRELLERKGVRIDDAAFQAKYFITEPLADLPTVLNKFFSHRDLLSSPEIVERMTYEACEDMARDGVKILELRYAPSFLSDAHDTLSAEHLHDAVVRGCARAETDFDMATGLICTLQRIKTAQENEHWLNFALDRLDDFIAIDLADDEVGYGAEPFIPLFQKAKEAGLGITIHAGEPAGCGSSKNIAEAVRELGADRIGHGVQILEDPEVVELIASRGIPLELCPTSNWLTGAVKSLADHPFLDIMAAGIQTTINTDDPSIMSTDINQEYAVLAAQGMTLEQMAQCNRWAAEASFIAPMKKAQVWGMPNLDA